MEEEEEEEEEEKMGKEEEQQKDKQKTKRKQKTKKKCPNSVHNSPKALAWIKEKHVGPGTPLREKVYFSQDLGGNQGLFHRENRHRVDADTARVQNIYHYVKIRENTKADPGQGQKYPLCSPQEEAGKFKQQGDFWTFRRCCLLAIYALGLPVIMFSSPHDFSLVYTTPRINKLPFPCCCIQPGKSWSLRRSDYQRHVQYYLAGILLFSSTANRPCTLAFICRRGGEGQVTED